MGKNLVQQRRGKGSTTFRAPSFRYIGDVRHPGIQAEGVAKGIVRDIVHSQGHYAPIAEVQFADKKEELLIAPEGMKVGDTIQMGPGAEINAGNILPLEKIPEGTGIFNIESTPGDGGKFVRSSGNFARITGKNEKGILVMLPSKKERLFNPQCRAAIGIIAGSGRTEKPLLKAGNQYHKSKARNRYYPIVCAMSMNAVAHKFGGSRKSKKGKPMAARRFACPGAKVGSIRPRRSGRRR
ncbi:MAG: 50S ribosomal protein L2 [Candidatus Woesearchaeota archaeon]